MSLVIAGRLVPLDRADPDADFKGRVYIDDSGVVERIAHGSAPAPTGFTNAPLIDVGDAFVVTRVSSTCITISATTRCRSGSEPKTEKSRSRIMTARLTRPYLTKGSISWPANALVQAEPEAMLAYVQLPRTRRWRRHPYKGWPAANRQFVQVLRNIDDETAGSSNHNLIYTSALTKTTLELGKNCTTAKTERCRLHLSLRRGTSRLTRRAGIPPMLQTPAVSIKHSSEFIAMPLLRCDWQRWAKRQCGRDCLVAIFQSVALRYNNQT